MSSVQAESTLSEKFDKLLYNSLSQMLEKAIPKTSWYIVFNLSIILILNKSH